MALRGRLAVLLAAAVVASGCGTGLPVPGGARLPRCADVPQVRAPASWYRDVPSYGPGEQPVDEVLAWAFDRPGYEDLWIEETPQAWVVVGFTAGAVDRQAEILATFPGAGVVAVEVPVTVAELEALTGRVSERGTELGIAWVAPAVDRGVVRVAFSVLTPERAADLAAAFPGAPLCVDERAAAAGPRDPAAGPERVARLRGGGRRPARRGSPAR